MERGRLTVLVPQIVGGRSQAALIQEEHGPGRQILLRHMAYAAGFMASSGQLCPYRDQIEVEHGTLAVPIMKRFATKPGR